MKQNTKDWIQHISAMLLIASAVAMAFVSFALTLDIGAGPLTYIGEALSAALGLFGISVYVVNRVRTFLTTPSISTRFMPRWTRSGASAMAMTQPETRRNERWN